MKNDVYKDLEDAEHIYLDMEKNKAIEELEQQINDLNNKILFVARKEITELQRYCKFKHELFKVIEVLENRIKKRECSSNEAIENIKFVIEGIPL